MCGIAGAGLLIATGAIHLDLYLTGYRSIPTIGWLFLLQVIVTFGLALAVLATFRSSVLFALTAVAGGLFALATLGGYLLSLRVGLFGFREVRTTAGIVAGVIDVAAFAALVAAAYLTGLGQRVARLNRPLLPAVALVSVIAFVLLGVDVAATSGGSNQATATAGQVLRVEHAGSKMVLANAKGLTLYWFAPDTASASRCTGDCATYWPPVFGKATAGSGVSTTKLGTITRPDGSTQATYSGHPLYTYIGDGKPGQESGNNLDLNGGLWYAVTP